MIREYVRFNVRKCCVALISLSQRVAFGYFPRKEELLWKVARNLPVDLLVYGLNPCNILPLF